jgi:hypothetical protein
MTTPDNDTHFLTPVPSQSLSLDDQLGNASILTQPTDLVDTCPTTVRHIPNHTSAGTQ